MAPAQLTQIYVTAAIALRTVLGHHLSCLPVCFSLKKSLLAKCDRDQPVSFFLNNVVCLSGLPVGRGRECGKPIRDEANPRLPALAFHSTGEAVLPEL